MKISKNGLQLIKQFEGLKLKAYDDGVGVWTIGYGTIRYPSATKVRRNDTITEEQAEAYLLHDVSRFENAVNKLVKVRLTQNQFDALVSFTYNLGESNLGASTLLRKLNAGNYTEAAKEFARWNKAGGKVMTGLTRRRAAEHDLFLRTS